MLLLDIFVCLTGIFHGRRRQRTHSRVRWLRDFGSVCRSTGKPFIGIKEFYCVSQIELRIELQSGDSKIGIVCRDDKLTRKALIRFRGSVCNNDSVIFRAVFQHQCWPELARDAWRIMVWELTPYDRTRRCEWVKRITGKALIICCHVNSIRTGYLQISPPVYRWPCWLRG